MIPVIKKCMAASIYVQEPVTDTGVDLSFGYNEDYHSVSVSKETKTGHT